jgi:hypothetical protein
MASWLGVFHRTSAVSKQLFIFHDVLYLITIPDTSSATPLAPASSAKSTIIMW